jgi:hypothetical protein
MRKIRRKGRKEAILFEYEKLLGGYGVDCPNACFDVYSNEWKPGSA